MYGPLVLVLVVTSFSHVGVRAWRGQIGHHFDHHGKRPRHHRAMRRFLTYMSDESTTNAAPRWNAPLLRGSLLVGASKPKSVVAIFPGVGGSAKNLIGLGEGWYEQNRDTQVILFDTDAFSGDRALSAVLTLLPTLFKSSRDLSSPAVDGYDGNYKLFDAGKSRSNFFGDLLLSCCNDVSMALQEVLSEYDLTDEDLILAGFSQGASIAAYTGFMRDVAGIVLMGGPGAPQEQLLPPPSKCKTRVCVISGDSDRFAPHEQLANLFRPYGGHVNILPGISHTIIDDHVELGGAFISIALGNSNAAKGVRPC